MFCSGNAGAGWGSTASREAERQDPRSAGCRVCAEAGGALPCHIVRALETDSSVATSQQRILDERQAKKAELERQREAARRVAMQQPPSVPSATADVSAMPPPPMSSAVPPAAGKIAAPVLPARLQQAMQVCVLWRSLSDASCLTWPIMQAHQQLTEAHRRDAEEKLLLAEEAKRKARAILLKSLRSRLTSEAG